MSEPRIVVVEDKVALAEWAAAHVAAAIERHEGRFVLALAGGSTPRLLHRVLADEYKALPWERVDLFVSDERAVPPDDERSNVGMVEASLIRPLGDRAPTFYRPDGVGEDVEAAAAAYEAKLLARTNGTGAGDIVMLGMGDDGHTASLFPGFGEPDGLVAATLAPSDTVASERLSFTYSALARAKELLVVVAGESKAAALAAVLEAGDDLPLTRALARCPGRVTLAADRAAAARLDQSIGEPR